MPALLRSVRSERIPTLRIAMTAKLILTEELTRVIRLSGGRSKIMDSPTALLHFTRTYQSRTP